VPEDEGVTKANTFTLAPRGGVLQATFAPRAGMVGSSMRYRGMEMLHIGAGLGEYVTRGETFGIPFLHPWANRLAAFDYFALGKQVRLQHGSHLVRLDTKGLPIHGLLAASPYWEVEHADEDDDPATLSARLDFGAYPALMAAFPFPHTVRQRIRDSGNEMEIATTVAADRGVPVPVSFGFHPYFRLIGAPRARWEIELPVYDHLLLDDHMIPTGEREPAVGLDGPLGGRAFDHSFAGMDHARPFVVAGGGRRIELYMDERYPFSQVYAPVGTADFICFEPMTAPTNALRSGHDLPIAQPAEDFTATWRLVVT
jgi:aldose 1-epimerase